MLSGLYLSSKRKGRFSNNNDTFLSLDLDIGLDASVVNEILI